MDDVVRNIVEHTDRFNLYKEISKDLRWCSSHEADEVWNKVDYELWDLTRNPWLIIQSVGPRKIGQLLKDKEFVENVERYHDRIKELLSKPSWFQEKGYNKKIRCIAYFCMEFGLSEALPIYSGGLGILAGDYLKTASDLGVPVIGIGLLYQQGYFRQVINAQGEQEEFYPYNDPHQLPIDRLRTSDGELVHITVDMPGRPIKLRVWEATVGRVKLYLLDSNDPFNSPADRGITSELYGGSTEMRLQQEIILGIGGWRILDYLGIEPDICHLNEGHAAFAILERTKSFMRKYNLPFNIALTATRSSNVFTTHTPVAAGFDRFNEDMMHRYFDSYVKYLGVSFDEFMSLGTSSNPDGNFNMAHLAINGSGVINGVSCTHEQVSKKIFLELFPGWPVHEIPITHVTNGIHVPSWESIESDSLWEKYCGKERWLGSLEEIEKRFDKISDEEIWNLRLENRKRLVKYVRKRLIRQLASIGASHSLIKEAEDIFDPNVMTIGFARRFAEYKRPTFLLYDRERLERILDNKRYPVQLIVAGKAHPRDEIGKEMVKEWNDFIRSRGIYGGVVFIADYDMLLAEKLVQGVDLWINNPRRPWEASGTSGMKVLVNGGLNLSELDGWWVEAYKPEFGWAIGDGKEHPNDPAWDFKEAQQAYDLLENEIIPMFYNRDEKGIPREWIRKIKSSMSVLTQRFSTNRMLREYVERIYIGASENFKLRVKDGFKAAIDIETTMDFLAKHWKFIHFGNMMVEEKDASYVIRLQVYLEQITPKLVEVQLYADPLEGEDAEIHTMSVESTLSGYGNSFTYAVEIPKERPIEHYTPRIVPSYFEAVVPLEDRHILWYR